ncbi:MAG: DUF4433 domain-containing protein [Chloroflexi bacterium]|nr:DUF4433 domain-containing protein [Chloroflexota bacterium]
MAEQGARVPDRPKIYHITHVNNLERIVAAGVLWSDAERISQGMDCEVVGMSSIKARRLERLEVGCHPGTKVGEYVPFYFCPRSMMLYILHMGNHPELTYRGGQGPLVHLEADLHRVVAWADAAARRWAFSDGNAGAFYTRFYKDVRQLDQVNWQAVAAHNWQPPEIKEGKQAEFLMYELFPWRLVERIGVQNRTTATKALDAISAANHRPLVSVEVPWYY